MQQQRKTNGRYQQQQQQQQPQQHQQMEKAINASISASATVTPATAVTSATSTSRTTTSSCTSNTVLNEDITLPYNIDWIFPQLLKPSKLWFLLSEIVILAVGVFSKIVLGILPVQHVCNTFRIRWSLAAHDICFTNKYHSLFFMYGKCIPVVRGIGVYQDAVNICIQKMKLGHWVHIFPEGKVNMTKEVVRLKWGVGRVIYESPKVPLILPMWHEGMDDVLPNIEPYRLHWGKKVTLNIGHPIDMKDFIHDLKHRGVKEVEARKLITDKIQEVFRQLRTETENLHWSRS